MGYSHTSLEVFASTVRAGQSAMRFVMPTRHRMSDIRGSLSVLMWGVLFVGITLTADSACAQAVVVQQPVVEQFGVSTVVSVPDRGSALLGSVSGSQSFGRRNGLSDFGSNLSRSTQHRGATAHVFIHDFAAMDAALLGRAPAARTDGVRGDRRALEGMAAHASDQLLREHQEIARSSSITPPPIVPQAASVSKARRLLSRSLR